MEKYYFTFGYGHAHTIAGFTYDKDIVVEIEAKDRDKARERMFELFGPKWSMQYDHLPNMDYFMRGIKKL